jgi:hypothetical protein
MNEQGGVELFGLGGSEQGQFLLQFGQQLIGRGGGRQGITDLFLRRRRSWRRGRD